MVIMKRRLVCCTWDKGLSVDFDQQNRIVTYNGLESYILNTNSRENESSTSKGNECVTDSQDDDDSSCSSSNNACSSFASNWTMLKKDEQEPDEWDFSQSPQHFYVQEKPSYDVQFSDVEIMKEKFAKLLLGEDISGGCKGVSPAVAISNAITNLSGTVFGELWKLEPLSNEKKGKWRREMDWLLSPTNYMIELVPAKQHGANGRTLEIMTPKVRSDIHMILPALQKLDSMLIETMDSMKNTEFWYAEGGSRAEGRERGARQSKRWWLPLPRVPMAGLSDRERKKLLEKGKFVHQVLKAAKAISENVLLEMAVPTTVREALPKSGKASLGDDLYRILNTEASSASEMFESLNVKSDHNALEIINRLEAATLAWKERILDQASSKSPVRTSWSFKRDPISELDKMESLLNRAEALIKQLKGRYPNLPQTFLDATKIQYGQDVGHSILEAYSRALSNLAYKILSRIGDIMQEDVISNPSSPMPTCCFPGLNLTAISDMPAPSLRVRHSLIDKMNCVDDKSRGSNAGLPSDDSKLPLSVTPICNRVLCSSASSTNSP